MAIKNLSRPELEPVASRDEIPIEWDGDLIEETKASGAVVTRQHHAPVDPGTAPTIFRVVTPTRYLAMVKAVSQMTNAEFAAYATDPDPDMVYVRAMLASVSGSIDINNADNLDLVEEGLDLMASAGHTGQLSAIDFKGAILAAWPQV
jgi:hypothetical protein